MVRERQTNKPPCSGATLNLAEIPMDHAGLRDWIFNPVDLGGRNLWERLQSR
jgi:hypothetical protein